jgi:hypothetical protein
VTAEASLAPGRIIVHELDVMASATWGFDHGVPSWTPTRHGYRTTFDPCPGYAHDLDTVRRAAEHVEARVPLLWPVNLYVADREPTARSNGHSNVHADGHYEGDEWVKDPPSGLILLAGKRIPPHPAMTRYLVAHEAGHNVEWMLVSLRDGVKHLHDGGLMREYVGARGLSPESLHHGECGTWHNSATEIFACDFRILVCGVELEFWPHPGVPRPENVDGLGDWWRDAVNRLAAAAVAGA